MDNKALLSPGKICAFRVTIGRSCLDSRVVYVDMIIYLFGMWMGSGLIASCLLSHGRLRFGSCTVVPVSSTASSSTVCTSLGLD